MPLIAARRFHNVAKVVQAIPAQSISNTTINGAALVNPQHDFNEVVISVNGGAFASSASGLVEIEVRNKAAQTWSAATESDGSTALEFLQTLYDDAGGGENATLIGTIPVGAIDWETNDALRVNFTSEGAQAMLVSVDYILVDAIRPPTGQVDYLFAKAHGGQS